MRLFGLLPAGADPRWVMALGATSLDGGIEVRNAGGAPHASLSLRGKSGEFDVDGTATIDQTGGSGGSRMVATLEMSAPTSGGLVRLLGREPAIADTAPSRINMTITGVGGSSHLTDIQIQAFGSRLDYSGKLATDSWSISEGKVSVGSTDISPLLAALAMPATELGSRLVFDAGIESRGGALAFSGISASMGDTKITGDLTASRAGEVKGNLDINRLNLPSILSASLLDWSSTGGGLEASLAQALPLGLSGKLDLKVGELVVDPSLILNDAPVTLASDISGIQFSMSGRDGQNRDMKLSLLSGEGEAGRSVSGHVDMPVDLARQLQTIDLQPVITGMGRVALDFEGEGRSGAGVLAALSGSGSYQIADTTLVDVSLASFAQALREAKSSASLTAAFAALAQGSTSIGATAGAITIEDGNVTLQPARATTENGDVEVKVSADLGSGLVNIIADMRLKSQANQPALSVSFLGPPDALVRSDDTSEVMSRIGYEIMQRDVAELERLQQEQERMAAEEDRLRLEDEARLIAYYVQRDELIMRRRELKLHGEMRLAIAEALRREIEEARPLQARINTVELRQRKRELQHWRQMTRLDTERREAIDRMFENFQVPYIVVPPKVGAPN